MTGGRRGRTRLRELQEEERARRERRPEWALRTTVLDLITGCGLQYFADHPVALDLALLDRAGASRDDPAQRRVGSEAEELGLRCVDALRAAVADLPPSGGAEDELRRLVIDVPARLVVGGGGEAASVHLVCWNETHGLAEGVSSPWRCVTQLAAIAHLSGHDDLLAPMTSLRDRYLRESDRRAALDDEVVARVDALRRRLDGVEPGP